MNFETKRLLLRSWNIDDLDDLYHFSSNEMVGPMVGWKPHSIKEEALQSLAQYINQDDHWAVVLKSNNRVIGYVKLNPDNNRGKLHAKSISFALDPEYWNQGFMSEAVQCIIQYAFKELKIDLLSAFHFINNNRSKRVLEKCGFVYEDTLQKTYERYDGQLFDIAIYSIHKSDVKCYN